MFHVWPSLCSLTLSACLGTWSGLFYGKMGRFGAWFGVRGVGVVLVAWLTINHSIIQRIHTMQHVRCFQGVLHPIGIALD